MSAMQTRSRQDLLRFIQTEKSKYLEDTKWISKIEKGIHLYGTLYVLCHQTFSSRDTFSVSDTDGLVGK
jgi:hypothetical protein